MKEEIGTQKIFMVEDRAALMRCYSEFLSKESAEIIGITTGEEAKNFFSDYQSPGIVLLDLELKDSDGLEVFEFITKNCPNLAVVVITSNGSYEISRKVISMGASDYLEKPFTRDRLCITMRNAQKQLRLEQAASPFGDEFQGFVGSSLPMQGVYRIIESAASSSKASVFITGESGTGKEVCSQAIHNLSERKDNECIILNCAAIPKDLMETEIFGHLKGAFTGATTDRDGAARRAHKGTLFLDEIGEMDMELQSKLLRFVQTGTFTKIGSSQMETVDVRFICATNRDPLEEIKNGRFREDLYYRLNVIPIDLPPLRSRGEDIIKISEHYLKIFSEEEGKNFSKLSLKTRDLFLEYGWPGNVRQLLNVLRNIIVLNKGTTVENHMLPLPFNKTDEIVVPSQSSMVENQTQSNESNMIAENHLHSFDTSSTSFDTNKIQPLWRVEMETIGAAIQLCDGNVTRAAKMLEINPSTIHRKKQAWIKNGLMPSSLSN